MPWNLFTLNPRFWWNLSVQNVAEFHEVILCLRAIPSLAIIEYKKAQID